MPLTWTFPQLLTILLVGFTFLVLAFSRSNPRSEALVPILAAHYLAINTICWNAFMLTAVWYGDESIFRFTFSPILPAVSFYLGVFTILAVIFTWISAIRSTGQFSRRQLWAFSASCLTFTIGLVVTTQSPIAVQSWIDSLNISN